MNIIPPRCGDAFEIKKGDRLFVTDIKGKQVADLVLFNSKDVKERISSGKTMDFEETIQISAGNWLWSNRGKKMALICEDDNAQNDFLLAPCCRETFRIMYGFMAARPSCMSNLQTALASYNIHKDDVPTAFNIFMNVKVYANGSLKVLTPKSIAGSTMVLRAEMDLIVGLTSCSAPNSNGGEFKPIGYEIETHDYCYKQSDILFN